MRLYFAKQFSKIDISLFVCLIFIEFGLKSATARVHFIKLLHLSEGMCMVVL